MNDNILRIEYPVDCELLHWIHRHTAWWHRAFRYDVAKPSSIVIQFPDMLEMVHFKLRFGDKTSMTAGINNVMRRPECYTLVSFTADIQPRCDDIDNMVMAMQSRYGAVAFHQDHHTLKGERALFTVPCRAWLRVCRDSHINREGWALMLALFDGPKAVEFVCDYDPQLVVVEFPTIRYINGCAEMIKAARIHKLPLSMQVFQQIASEEIHQ